MVVKYMFFWKDHPSKSEKAIDEHYESEHTRLARKAFVDADGFIKYVQNKITNFEYDSYNSGELEEKVPPYDRCVELWFETEEQFRAAFDTSEMEACFMDHENFMHTDTEENLHIFKVEETVALERDQQTDQLKLGLTRADEENFGINKD